MKIKLENLTAAFVVYINLSKYKIYSLVDPDIFIQEKADAINIKVKIRAESGKWRPLEGISGFEYTHVIEVYGNDIEKLLSVRRAIGNYSSWADPRSGSCHRCHIVWGSVNIHTTDYKKGGGCFSLCEWCWGQLTPEQRWPYYQTIILNWESMSYAPKDTQEIRDNSLLIKEAVFAGK